MIPDYPQRTTTFQQESDELAQRYERLGWIRLVVFVALLAAIILAWRETPWWSGLLVTGLGIAGFAQLVRWHGRIQQRSRHQGHLAAQNRMETQVQQQEVTALYEGDAFADPNHPYSFDLDFFGPYSLFQFINRGYTSIGQATLAAWLQQPAATSTIEERQAAVQELAEMVDWQHHFRAFGADLEEEEGQIDRLKSWLDQPPIVLGNTSRKLALWIAPILFLVATISWLYGLHWFFAILFFIPAGIWLRRSQEEVTRLHAQTGRAAETLKKYAQLIEHTETNTFSSPLLKRLQSAFTEGDVTASRAINQLAYRVSQLDVRYNAFVLLLEFSIVWDLQQAYRMDLWQARHRETLPDWFAALADLEALISLGNMATNHPDWTFPSIHDAPQLDAQDLGHPLIPGQQRVTNSIVMPTQGHMHLITGSNMAGKSTWLRTVGINVVLGLAGSPVCASRMSMPQLQVYTSMRTQDALHESTSSFYAELKRLKFIIDAVEDPSKTDGRPVFFLLDEILKGTNSRDRHTGAKALIRQLIRSRGAGLIATHDLELGALQAEAEGRVENWAIEVAIQEGELYFDYKLKPGVSQSFNATILMQRMGIKIQE